MKIRDENAAMVRKALELSLKRGKINHEQYKLLLAGLKRIEQENRDHELSRINSGMNKLLNDIQNNVNTKSKLQINLSNQHQLV